MRATDGDARIDLVAGAFSRSTPTAASDAWHTAGVVAAVRDHSLDTFRHDETGVALVGDTTGLFLCEDETRTCYELPEVERVRAFSCADRRARWCDLEIETTERVERWSIDFGRTPRRRLSSTRSLAAEPTDPTRREIGRDASGPWERLAIVATRPAFLDDPRLGPSSAIVVGPAIPVAIDDEAADDTEGDSGVDAVRCFPFVASARRDDVVVRAVGCAYEGEFSLGTNDVPYVAFVIGDRGTVRASSLFPNGRGDVEPMRVVAATSLAVGAIGFETSSDDGHSPSGTYIEELRVALPGSESDRIEVFDLEFAANERAGLGHFEEYEGYVVQLEAYRARYEVGAGRLRLVDCERWTGIHARARDQWLGDGAVEPLDLSVAFGATTGFADRESVERRVRATCIPEPPASTDEAIDAP